MPRGERVNSDALKPPRLVAGRSALRSLCGSAALSCGKAPPFRRFAALSRFFGEAAPRRLRRSLNPTPSWEAIFRKGGAFPQDRAAEPLSRKKLSP